MEADLKSLKIDRSAPERRGGWAARWILAGVGLFLLIGAAALVQRFLGAAPEVATVRVQAQQVGGPGRGTVVLNATGYIVAAHKIQVASKVVGKVAWIGVEKGDKVKAGQVIVRLEDDEYRAQLQQARGNLAALEARLAELERGSRPEEIEAARAGRPGPGGSGKRARAARAHPPARARKSHVEVRPRRRPGAL